MSLSSFFFFFFFLHTFNWFQLLLYNNHNLTCVICLHTVCFIWPIDRTLSGATTLGQSGPGSNGNDGVLHIPQISKAGASPSVCFMLYLGHLLGCGGLTPLQRWSLHILQPLSTRPSYSLNILNIMVIIIGKGINNLSSNLGLGCLCFTLNLYSHLRHESICSLLFLLSVNSKENFIL